MSVVSTRRVALLGDAPAGLPHEWVQHWLGVYSEEAAAAHVHGRPVFTKEGDPSKILWYTAAGHWQVGRRADIASGWGLFAARGAAAERPDAVASRWEIATVGRGWVEAPGIACVGAPLATIWLHGHAPSAARPAGWLRKGWVASWLGAYDLHSVWANGRPVYRQRASSRNLLWFARPESGQARASYWFLGPHEDVGQSRGWLSTPDDALLPHQVRATWRVASAQSSASGGWILAPRLRVTANSSEAIGWYRSLLTEEMRLPAGREDAAPLLEESLDKWRRSSPPLERELSAAARAIFSAAGPSFTSRALLLAADCVDALASLVQGAQELALAEETWRWTQPALQLLPQADVDAARAWWRAARGWREWVGVEARAVQSAADAMAAYVWFGALWLVVLVLLRRWRAPETRELEESDSETESESGEEKRLAFAFLSSAIEEVKETISEQQYLELYNAAQWCFNLTPSWASTVPSPPPSEEPGANSSPTQVVTGAGVQQTSSPLQSGDSISPGPQTELCSQQVSSPALGPSRRMEHARSLSERCLRDGSVTADVTAGSSSRSDGLERAALRQG
ncbi:hypothetical protein AB1Y20_001074 [Prymnesium parvum]|uniref:Uncharacterized protein n=1 Tax=Prymnesium parvum TaxID=97485 RepID=A0AB34KAL2_PRYPA